MPKSFPRRERFSDVLVAKGLIDESQLAAALQEQLSSGQMLTEVLARLGYVTEDQLVSALSEWLDIPFMDIKRFKLCVSNEVLDLLSHSVIRQYKVVPLAIAEDAVIAVTAYAVPADALDDLERLLGRPIRLHAGKVSEVQELLGGAFGS